MGLDQQYRWFVESVYVLSSLPVSQRSFDPEWEIFVPLIPPTKPGGRSRKWPMRKML